MKQEDINRRTKEAVDYLVQSLDSGRSEVLVQYLAAMGRFHNYSFGNIMLIARQRPDATKVAGFRTWNSLGRFVNKGERGILILAPMVRRKREERESLPEETVASERQLLGFRAAYVFDVSQTVGNDLPHLTEVQGDVVGLRERLTAWLAGQAIAVMHSVDIAPARGVSSAARLPCFRTCPPPRSFPLWCMKSRMNCSTGATGVSRPPSRFVRPKRKPLRSRCANPLGSGREAPPLTTSSSGMAMLSC
jgi:hypothetical protein